MDRKLLDIRVCPATRQPLSMLDAAGLQAVNRAIGAGGVQRGDGTPQADALREALLTRDRKTVYRVEDGIPENSLPAFRRAVEAGYGIELDLHLTTDGQLVVFHDDTLDRVCGVSGRVDESSYPELQQLRLSGTDETIPLFSQVLEVVAGKIPMIVEVKYQKNYPEYAYF